MPYWTLNVFCKRLNIWKTSWLGYEFTKVLLLSETHRRPIEELSDISTCFIGDPSETDIPHEYIIPIYINKEKVYKIKNI